MKMNKNKLTIDIGSGHRPSIEADILLEYVSSSNEHRWGKNLKIDRPIILYDGDKFPLKNKSFNFSICKHVLEHVNNPEIFLNEIMRISKSGYIETPSEISELLFTPYEKHKWIISKENNKLLIKKKIESNMPRHGSLLDVMFFYDTKLEEQLYEKHRKLFLVEYSWQNEINYEITNSKALDKKQTNNFDYWRSLLENNLINNRIIDYFREYYFIIKRKMKNIDLEDILMCLDCENSMNKEDKMFICNQCGNRYIINDKIVYCGSRIKNKE